MLLDLRPLFAAQPAAPAGPRAGGLALAIGPLQLEVVRLTARTVIGISASARRTAITAAPPAARVQLAAGAAPRQVAARAAGTLRVASSVPDYQRRHTAASRAHQRRSDEELVLLALWRDNA